jgi:hypothetical protein
VAILSSSEPAIHLVSLTDNSTRDIKVTKWSNLNSLNWSADGRELIVPSGSTVGSTSRATLLRIGLDGTTKPLMEFKGSSETWGIESPDGKRMAIYGTDLRSRNIYMLEPANSRAATLQ